MNPDAELADSLAHPTLNGTWLGRPAGNTFQHLAAELERHGYRFACAVGLWGQDGFEAEAFARAALRHPRLVPIAGIRPSADAALGVTLDRVRDLGYRGVKLHPRFSGVDVADPAIPATFRMAAERDLTVFFCTFQYGPVERWPSTDPLSALVAALRAAPRARVVLLHGGDVGLMRYMQLMRFNDRLLLDLSHTILKYAGSSLDADIRFLFHVFDRRICVGTDYPQFRHDELRARFDVFADGLSPERRENIAWRNLGAFVGWTGG